MKLVKILFISLIAFFFIFFAFYKSDKVNIEGNWSAKKIVLNGEQLYPAEIDSFFKISPEIIINHWNRSIYIHTHQNKLNASFEIEKNINGNHQIKLSSNEKSLNGRFELRIDTLHLSPREYIINVKIESNSTLIDFQRKVYIKPWKPEFPRRGQV